MSKNGISKGNAEMVEMAEFVSQLRSMSLGYFSGMLEEKGRRSDFANTTFGKDNPYLVRRITACANFANEKEITCQKEYISLIGKELSRLRWDVCSCTTNKTERTAELQEVKEALEIAQMNYRVAKGKLEAAEKALSHAQDTESECQTKMEEAQKRIEDLGTPVLMHITTTMSQLEKYQDRRIVVTSVDFPSVKNVGVVDEVFYIINASEIVLTEIENMIPYDDYSETQFMSAIAYVMMVAYYYLNDIHYDLAYADKVIDEMLKKLKLI